MTPKQVGIVVGTTVATVGMMGALAGMSWYYYGDSIGSLLPYRTAQTVTMNHLSGSAEAVPDVVAKTIPAVVSVVITADVPIIENYYEQFWSPFGFFGGNVTVPRQRQVGTEKQEIGGGSGFLVSADGYVITNKHVVDTADAEYSVRLNDGSEYVATVVAKDALLDVAVLKLVAPEGTEFPYLDFSNTDPRLGESVIAIGNVLAEFPNSVSVGVVSGLSRSIVANDTAGNAETLEGLIQTDAAINRGNSGGPLLALDGSVVGVNVAMASESENIGFALPASLVHAVYESVLRTGSIVRPYLGVRYEQVTKQLALEDGLSVSYGARIIAGSKGEAAVVPGSPAAVVGLEAGDIILEINGTKLDGTLSLATRLRTFAPGDTIALRILHNGSEREVLVTLDEAPIEN